ncbi:hypothetical protein RvY_17048 [Ramazzottius varieornatus]|uniref:Uncharacterized protein n=1 Tax=Ramazzottius varieornatus TaxID=947166 RepID=A0A1D1W0S6_RAMVA|nr:hypothetical protein RvY_17048 [Ramazzottius varieornatus]
MGVAVNALILLAMPMLLIACLLMLIMNSIAISEAILPAFRHFEDEESLAQRKLSWQKEAPTDSLDHLLWFVQITDLHVSEYVDPKRITQLEQFCTETVDTIRPAVVISSGDLTDAKTPWGSHQHEWEWKEYSRVLRETKVADKTVWLDIRGNHDTFNVPSRDSKLNYYKSHAQRGNETSYHYVHKYGWDKVSFIAVDAAPEPGFRRPFNFFGVVTEEDLARLTQLEIESRSSNVTIWFGHYPTSIISAPQPGLHNVMAGGIAYLSGHLHTLGGLLPELYAMQKSGTLELELGDWKDNRLFRIIAVDHDLFSFMDLHFNQLWPVALITNPKNVKFYAPVHEPLDRISRSTHVRIIAFSPDGIQSVEVQLPEELSFQPARQVQQSALYVRPWNASHYDTGTHTIQARITDKAGRVRLIRQDFATCEAEVPVFGVMRRLVLMADLGRVFFTMTYGTAGSLVLVLLVFGTTGPKTLYSLVVRKLGWDSVSLAILRDLQAAITLPFVFWTLILVTTYTVTMPWFYGEIVEGEWGVVFPYGIWMERSNRWLTGQMTYMYTVTHLFMHCVPLTLCTILYTRSRLRHPQWRYHRFVYHLVFAFLIIWQGWSLRIFHDSYGGLSVLTNGLHFITGILATLFLWWKCWRVRGQHVARSSRPPSSRE